MKKFAFLFLSLLMVNVVVWASNDKPIQVSEMPKMAQQFIPSVYALISAWMEKYAISLLVYIAVIVLAAVL